MHTSKTCKQVPEMLETPSSLRNKPSGQPQTELIQCKVGAGEQSEFNPKRRGYMFNTETGKSERVVRRRKRKTGTQLETLNEQFDFNPHWSKETLYMISEKTGLTMAQVYKWGWDQKKKKFTVEEAMKMRQYERMLDQRNEAKIRIPFLQKMMTTSMISD